MKYSLRRLKRDDTVVFHKLAALSSEVEIKSTRTVQRVNELILDSLEGCQNKRL